MCVPFGSVCVRSCMCGIVFLFLLTGIALCFYHRLCASVFMGLCLVCWCVGVGCVLMQRCALTCNADCMGERVRV